MRWCSIFYFETILKQSYRFHTLRDMCFPGGETYVTKDTCFPGRGTHIPSDMCSPTWETRIPSDMCSPIWETRIPTQHDNGDLRKIKVCVNLRKVGHPTLRKLSTARKGL